MVRGADREIWHDLCRLDGMPGYRHGTDVGIDTIKFISKSGMPANKRVTYGEKECSLRPQKSEAHRVQLTVGGNRLTYNGDTATQCASLTTTKLLINNTISTPGARFDCLDIKNMYYGTPMREFEYMKIRFSKIPADVTTHYRLKEIVHTNGYVYIEIQKGMPVLKQAGRIANKRLTEHLAKYGYFPCPRTPSMWQHETHAITFALVVDNFGVKYGGCKHFQHLINALRDLYEITVDEKGEKFLALTIKWDYDKKKKGSYQHDQIC